MSPRPTELDEELATTWHVVVTFPYSGLRAEFARDTQASARKLVRELVAKRCTILQQASGVAAVFERVGDRLVLLHEERLLSTFHLERCIDVDDCPLSCFYLRDPRAVRALAMGE